MKTPPQRLQPGTDGPPRLVRAINELREFAISAKVRRGRGLLVRETSGGTNLSVEVPEAAAGGAGESQRMLVTAVFNDYLVCNGPDGAVNVAKPWRLRRNPFHGNTVAFVDEQGRAYSVAYTYDGASVAASPSVRRTVSIIAAATATFTETQVVIPRIKTGFDYVDVMTSGNGTGVAGVDLIDLNTDGRAWARER